MAAPELAGWITSPSVKETPTLRPKLATLGGQSGLFKQPSIPESIYSLSNSSDEVVGYFDQHQNTSTQPDMATDSVDTFLALIAAERLSRMPHNGSSWDRVLKDAEAFANNVAVYQRMLQEVRLLDLLLAQIQYANIDLVFSTVHKLRRYSDDKSVEQCSSSSRGRHS